MIKEYIFINYYSYFDRFTGKTHHFKYGDRIFLRQSVFSSSNYYYFFDFSTTGIDGNDEIFKYAVTIEEFFHLRNKKIQKIIEREE